ncbi:MAG: hypothetical protein WKF71_04170 [Pyrinomonadaceae bacterium]
MSGNQPDTSRPIRLPSARDFYCPARLFQSTRKTLQGQFIAFRPLNDLQRTFPVTDRSNFFSFRTDHNLNE